MDSCAAISTSTGAGPATAKATGEAAYHTSHPGSSRSPRWRSSWSCPGAGPRAAERDPGPAPRQSVEARPRATAQDLGQGSRVPDVGRAAGSRVGSADRRSPHIRDAQACFGSGGRRLPCCSWNAPVELCIGILRCRLANADHSSVPTAWDASQLRRSIEVCWCLILSVTFIIGPDFLARRSPSGPDRRRRRRRPRIARDGMDPLVRTKVGGPTDARARYRADERKGGNDAAGGWRYRADPPCADRGVAGPARAGTEGPARS